MTTLRATYDASDLSLGAILVTEREMQDLAQSPAVRSGILTGDGKYRRWLDFVYADESAATAAAERLQAERYEVTIEGPA